MNGISFAQCPIKEGNTSPFFLPFFLLPGSTQTIPKSYHFYYFIDPNYVHLSSPTVLFQAWELPCLGYPHRLLLLPSEYLCCCLLSTCSQSSPRKARWNISVTPRPSVVGGGEGGLPFFFSRWALRLLSVPCPSLWPCVLMSGPLRALSSASEKTAPVPCWK